MIRPHYVPLFQSICHSEKLADIKDNAARFFYTLLLTHCDAWGRTTARSRVLFAKVWSLYGKDADVPRFLDELERVGLIERYECDGEPFLHIPDWDEKAGRVGQGSRRAESEYPAPPARSCEPDKSSRPLARGTRPLATPRDPSQGVEEVASDIHDPSQGVVEVAPRARVHAHAPARAPSEPSRTEPRGTEQSQATPAEPRPADEPPGLSDPGVQDPSPPKPPRKAATGPHADCIRWWRDEWTRTRLGSVCTFSTADGVAVSWMLKQGDEQEVRRRMTAMLEDPDAWIAKNASPSMLRSKWNAYAVAVRAHSHAGGKSPDMAEVFRGMKRGAS